MGFEMLHLKPPGKMVNQFCCQLFQ